MYTAGHSKDAKIDGEAENNENYLSKYIVIKIK